MNPGKLDVESAGLKRLHKVLIRKVCGRLGDLERLLQRQLHNDVNYSCAPVKEDRWVDRKRDRVMNKGGLVALGLCSWHVDTGRDFTLDIFAFFSGLELHWIHHTDTGRVNCFACDEAALTSKGIALCARSLFL